MRPTLAPQLLVLVVALLSSCATPQTRVAESETEAARAVVEESPSAGPTDTATATQTLIPGDTPTPRDTPTGTPTDTPTATHTWTPTRTHAPTSTNTPTHAHTPTGPPSPTDTVPPAPPGMIYVPAGHFERPDGESMYIEAYYIDAQPITWGEYRRCVDQVCCGEVKHLDCDYGLCEDYMSMHLATCAHADRFCGCVGKRLATWPEWLYACGHLPSLREPGRTEWAACWWPGAAQPSAFCRVNCEEYVERTWPWRWPWPFCVDVSSEACRWLWLARSFRCALSDN
jgi:formylglycine-generating enzyme required for sulfatase activity